MKFSCPSCHKSITCSSQHAGKQARCPHCRHQLRVPKPTVAATAPPANKVDDDLPELESLFDDADFQSPATTTGNQFSPPRSLTTPQSPKSTTVVPGPEAGLGRRFLANAIDWGLLIVVVFALTAAYFLVTPNNQGPPAGRGDRQALAGRPMDNQDPRALRNPNAPRNWGERPVNRSAQRRNRAATLFVSLSLLLPLAYFALLEALGPRATLGKKLAGTRVVMRDGRPAGLGATTLRHLARPLSLPIVAAGAPGGAFIRLYGFPHDRFTGTRVVMARR